MTNHATDLELALLRQRITGTVHGPHDAGYAQAGAAWNLAWTHRPAAVVRAVNEADVVTAVTHAAGRGYAVAVQATGHGVTVPADDQSVLVVTADLDQVRIDPVSATATVGGGATWTPVIAAAAPHGLAPLAGSAPDVGAVGYTLGGGFGWLGRAHGLAVDSLRSLRVVLADGRVVTCSPDVEPELFWALAGTGGSCLGVVVEMTVALAPVDLTYSGNLLYPPETARELFTDYLAWAADNPEQMASAFNITAFPPLEMVPEPLRGRTFAIVRGCHPGDLAEGRRRVDELRRLRAPELDLWDELPYSRMAEISQDPVDPVPAASSGRWLDRVDSEVVDVMLEAMAPEDGPSPLLFTELRHAGGAITGPNPAVSFGARSGSWSLELVGMVPGPEADRAIEQRFTRAWHRTARLFAAQPGYLNFAEGHERIELATRAFDTDTWRRLAQVKKAVDPTGVFRHGIALDDA